MSTSAATPQAQLNATLSTHSLHKRGFSALSAYRSFSGSPDGHHASQVLNALVRSGLVAEAANFWRGLGKLKSVHAGTALMKGYSLMFNSVNAAKGLLKEMEGSKTYKPNGRTLNAFLRCLQWNLGGDKVPSSLVKKVGDRNSLGYAVTAKCCLGLDVDAEFEELKKERDDVAAKACLDVIRMKLLKGEPADAEAELALDLATEEMEGRHDGDARYRKHRMEYVRAEVEALRSFKGDPKGKVSLA